MMTAEDKAAIQSLVDAMRDIEGIPKEKLEYILGYAECLVGMAGRQHQPDQASASA